MKTLKILIGILLCTGFIAGSASGYTISAIELAMGTGDTLATFHKRAYWNTYGLGNWKVGFKDNVNGSFLNDTIPGYWFGTIPDQPMGDEYFLFTDPGNEPLYDYARLEVVLSNGDIIAGLFDVPQKRPASGAPWNLIESTPQYDFQLSWMGDDKDEIATQLFGANNVNDNYYKILVSPIPLPATIWLLGFGLIGLIGIRRRKTSS